MNKILFRRLSFALLLIIFSSCNKFFKEKYKVTKEDCLNAKSHLYNGLYEVETSGKFFGLEGRDSILVGNKPIISLDNVLEVQKSYDEIGRPMPIVKLNKEAAKVFENFTRDNIGKKLAIIVNDKLLMAPIINDKIAGGKVQVSMNSTEEEVDKLVKDISIISQCSKKKND